MANRLKSAAIGAGTGAVVGSAFPGIGTGIGAIGGAILGFLSPDKKQKNKQVALQNPQQQAALNQYLQQLQGAQGGQQMGQDYLQRILSNDPQAYNEFAAPYLQQFKEQTLPGISERFSALGGALGGGAGSSTGFGQAVSGAGAQLQSNLAGLHAQLQQQAAQQAMANYQNMAQAGFGARTFEPVVQPYQPGFATQTAAGIAQGAGQGFGQNFGFNMGQNLWGNTPQGQNPYMQNPPEARAFNAYNEAMTGGY